MTPLWHPSPNHDGRTAPVDMVVIHYTDMVSADAALRWLCDPQSRVSAHYLIAADGTVVQLVREEHRAWHAGSSYWGGVRDNNGRSIGIELDSPGHAGGKAPEFADAQIRALTALLDGIRARHAVPQRNVVAHSDIAPHRKIDPGEAFPWPLLCERGHALATPTVGEEPMPLDDRGQNALARALADIGYAPAMASAATVFGETKAVGGQPSPPASAAARPPLLPIAQSSRLFDAVADAFHRRFRPAWLGRDPDQASLRTATAIAAAVRVAAGALPPSQVREQL